MHKNAETFIENTKETKKTLAVDKKEAGKLVDKKNDYLNEIGDSDKVEKNTNFLLILVLTSSPLLMKLMIRIARSWYCHP